jgi:hypothetical protein
VAEATSAHISAGISAAIDWSQGYGYHFWRGRQGFRGDGAFGQYCVVVPKQATVLAMTAGLVDAPEPMEFLWEHLVPAMTAGALPADEPARQALAEKCASLAVRPVPGQAVSPMAALISRQTYRADQNELGLTSLVFTFGAAVGTLKLQTAEGEQVLPVGFGSWQRGETSLFNDSELNGQTAVFTNGAWTADDRLTVVIRLAEGPPCHWLNFHFAGDKLFVEGRLSGSLDGPKPWLLTACSQP